jgi:transposase
MTPALVCEIVTLFHGGESQRRIAQTLRIGRKAVRRVLELVEHACIDSAEQRPAQPEKRRPSLLDAFETTIADLLARYPNITIQRLREELRRSGYAGGHTILTPFPHISGWISPNYRQPAKVNRRRRSGCRASRGACVAGASAWS